MLSEIIKIKLSVIIFSIILIGCYPDRHPVSPEEYNTRRPKIIYNIPATGDSVYQEMQVDTWFDWLMESTSVENAFSLSMIVAEEMWTTISTAATMDQSYSDPQKLYLALQKRGAFISENNGQDWKFISGLAEQRINEIKIDPQNITIIYALSDSLFLKSSDDGQTWEPSGHGMENSVSPLILSFDPSISNYLWLGTNEGIYHSADAGQNWSKSGELPNWNGQKISSIIVDPLNSNIIYASTLGRFIYKSENAGDSWIMIRGVTDRLPTSQIYDIIIHPKNSTILYAATINKGVYKSIDSGENWNSTNNELTDFNTRELKFDYSDNPVLYLATVNHLFIFDNDGNSWNQLNLPSEGTIIDFHFSPTNLDEIKLVLSGIVFTTTNRTQTWVETNKIDRESITVNGTFLFTKWQGEQILITSAGDTTIIMPYVNEDALAGYYAGFTNEPPIDPDPYATKVEFIPENNLYSEWKYMILTNGAFDGNNWREVPGARNINGMSLELDYISYIIVK